LSLRLVRSLSPEGFPTSGNDTLLIHLLVILRESILNKNTFSIVIPAHNGEQFIRAALRSALNQTRSADEVIVIDDASADRTGDIIRAPEFRGQVTYFYNKHSTGFADAWNRAAGKAGSDFVTILHQDDLLHPEYLYHIEKALLSYPVARHLYAACSYIDADGNVTAIPPAPHSPEPVLYSGKEYAHNYLNGVITNIHIHRCPGVMTARDLLLSECTYRKEAGHIADDDFFMRIGMHTDVVGISQPLASYRQHAGSATGQLDLLSLKLAEAYIFQIRFHHTGSSILNAEDITKINRLAVRFTNALLFQGLLYKRSDWTKRALELRAEVDGIIPGFAEQELPAWSRPLWVLAPKSGGSRLAATVYVQALHGLRQMRDLGRSVLHRR